jgi:hypothetical protein
MFRPAAAPKRTLRSDRRRSALFVLAWVLLPTVAGAQVNVNVLTNRYDPARTGANLVESVLTTQNVNAGQFGKLYSLPVDGAVYAQPLYVSGITVAGVRRNVLYVATMNDKIYAFDADRRAAPLWVTDFTDPPDVTAIPITDIVPPNLNIIANVGIQSTPVIDRASSTIYLVARTKERGAYVQRLHALDIATGAERLGSPVVIEGSVTGNAPDATVGATGSVITFDPKVQLQRAGLALSNGVVVIAWAAHEDVTPSHGWIMGFNSSTLARVGIFSVERDAYLGGIWQGGRAPAVDGQGNVYFATGNGRWDGTRNFGDSLLKFSVDRSGITLIDYFTPANEAVLDVDDDDLSGSGFTLLPDTDLLLGGGKEGVLFLLDSNDLGKKTANDAGAVQKLPVTGGHVMGGVTYWNSPAHGPVVYNWSEDDVLKAFQLVNGHVITTPVAQGSAASPGHPGGSLTVSADGSTPGSGIVWASMPWLEDAKHGIAAGILRAYDADTLDEIWSTETAGSRDRLGDLMKFVPPVVANGRVYLPNQNNELNVYGLLPPDFSVSATPNVRVLAPGSSTTFTVSVGAQGAFTGRVDLEVAAQPAGASVSLVPSYVIGSGTSTVTVAVGDSVAPANFDLTITGHAGGLSHSTTASIYVNPAGAGTGSIGIDFVGLAKPMADTEVAGVVPQSHWNVAPGAVSAAPLAVVDDAGALTGATVTWEADSGWQTPIADAAGDRRMMKGYLDNPSSAPIFVTVAGLAPRTYDVYVYTDGDNGTAIRSASYAIEGPGLPGAVATAIDGTRANFTGSFAAAQDSAGNYIRFTVTATQFRIVATPVDGTTQARRAPINGIQIVPVANVVARAVSIDFVGTVTSVLAPAAVAGVVPKAHWNSARGAVRLAPLPLVDETGAGTSAAVTWISNNTWMLPIVESSDNATMMRGYLDTASATATTVTVSGLVPATYDVYVYADGDNRSFLRSATYWIGGGGLTATTRTLTDPAGTDYAGTFARAVGGGAGNYLHFTISGGAFTLVATPLDGSTSTRRAPINAIQIVPRPAAVP